jgi:hypothetical protein
VVPFGAFQPAGVIPSGLFGKTKEHKMKFRSTTGEEVSISLTSGHTAVVGVELTELEKRFHKEAISKGCLPEGVEDEQPVKPEGFDRVKVITAALNAMADGADEGDFTASGKPVLAKLSARVGFNVSRVEADAIWDEISKDE